MDRLSAVAAVLAGLAVLTACEEQPADPAAAARVNAVAADPKRQESLAGFCDTTSPAGAGPAVQLPALTGAPAPAPTSGWRWINLWATWCKPCVEEMPRLRRFHQRLTAAGKPFDLVFVSVAEGDEGLRFAAPDQLDAWLRPLGLDSGATIPVHVFVDPSGHRRCIRAGPIADRDLPLIERLLSGS